MSLLHLRWIGEMGMDTRYLEYFKIVYEEKSIQKASKKLFISPQGLGKIIQNIEKEFDAVFFIRNKSGVFPTASGTLFYEQCIKTSHELQTLHGQIRQLESKNHALRIGFAGGTLQIFPLEILMHFIEEHPNLQIQWYEYLNDHLIQRLLDSELDYGFVVGKTENDHLVQNCRYATPVVLLVYEGHPLYNETCISLDMLKNEKLIIMNEHFHIYHDFTTACSMHGFTPQIIAKTLDGATLYALCTRKLGLAVAPFLPIQQMLHVKAIPFLGEYSWEIYGCYEKKQQNNAVIQELEAYLENQSYLLS